MDTQSADATGALDTGKTRPPARAMIYGGKPPEPDTESAAVRARAAERAAARWARESEGEGRGGE